MTLHLLVFQHLPPSTTVNSHLIEFPGGQKLSFTAGLSKSVPRTMRLFAEFPEGCCEHWLDLWSGKSLAYQGQPQNPGCRRESCHRENLPGRPLPSSSNNRENEGDTLAQLGWGSLDT